MTKRLLWISFFVIPPLLMALLVWHRVRDLGRSRFLVTTLNRSTVNPALLQDEGIFRNITATELADAANTIARERQMWSLLGEMSADIHIELDSSNAERLLLNGTVKLRRVEMSSNDKSFGIIANYKMTLADAKSTWEINTDGNIRNTVVTCPDPKIRETITKIGAEAVLHLLTFPQYYLASIYSDNLYSQNVTGFTLDQSLKLYAPWVVTNSIPHSYTFWYAQGFQNRVLLAIPTNAIYTSPVRNAMPDFTLLNGHFYRFRRMVYVLPGPRLEEKESVYCENLVESNGFSYPTLFRMTPAPTPWPYPDISAGKFVLPEGPLTATGQLRIALSNVSLTVKNLIFSRPNGGDNK